MDSVIRRAAFETNSSSTHSLTIASGEFVPDAIPESNGVVKIWPGEFGWGVDTHYDAATKASYCLTYVKTNSLEPQEEMLRRVIEKETGATVEFVKESGGYYEWGYIDHQSDRGEGDKCGPAFESDDALRAFIFNPSSVLEIDNDNH